MFDDYHPMIVAGFCGAVISIFLSKAIGVFYVYRKRQKVVESLQVLDDRSRPVLERMAKYDSGISWTQALDDAKSIPVSWYNVFNILKLYEKINDPTSDIYTTMKVAQLVAAEAAAERVQGEWEWVSIYWMEQWELRKVRVSPQHPPTFTSLPPTPPYPTSPLPSCPAPESDQEYVAVRRSGEWEWVWVGVPGSEDWVWQWIAVPRSGKWEWLWNRVPPRTGSAVSTGVGPSHTKTVIGTPSPPAPAPPPPPPKKEENKPYPRPSVQKEKMKGKSMEWNMALEEEEEEKEKEKER